ncbi:fucolectin-like [Labeo rohita]|uniref:fucolectin-like n=1 Tax=Labeo rohita TaxID=84645 RepID=UPI0021E1EA16|nr:fucolectin-like [Labeo rohita]
MKLSGDAAQSSVFEYFGADRAIDGVKYAPGTASFCTHSVMEKNPWWRLDLLDNCYIIAVTITNRADCCSERLDRAEIRIGNSLENNGNNNPICAVVTSISAGASYTYLCPYMEGRYVNVVAPGDSRVLTLCEVEVYRGFPAKGITGIKLTWTKPPQPEVEQDIEEGKRGLTTAVFKEFGKVPERSEVFTTLRDLLLNS